MSNEEKSSDGSGDSIDANLISAIEDIESSILEPGEEDVYYRVFLDYVGQLDKIPATQLRGSQIEYSYDDGGEYQINTIGMTPFGQLGRVTRSVDGKRVASGYFILCGSLILTAQFDELSDNEKISLTGVFTGTALDNTPIKLEGSRFALVNKGLCEDAYLIFLKANPFDAIEPKIIGADDGYSDIEKGMILSVRLYGTNVEKMFFIEESPVVTEEKIHHFIVYEPQEDTVLTHYIG